MISTNTLRQLTTQRIKDAEALLRFRRNAGSVYLAGYALEYSLKKKIGETLKFKNGFPDRKTEFVNYAAAVATPPFRLPVSKLSEIRNHDLEKLLFYSGTEFAIKTRLREQWSAVCRWRPEDRYIMRRYSDSKAAGFLTAVKMLIKHLL